MDTAAVIGLVLAAVLLGALLPVLFQLRATLRAAQNTLESAQRTIDEIHGMTPAVQSTVRHIEQVSATLTPKPGGSNIIAMLSDLLPVAVSAFRAFTASDEADESDGPRPPSECPAPNPSPNSNQGEST